MILFSILLFGLALAIPASRAIQEAEMRDRIAGVASGGDQGSSDSQSPNESSFLPLIDETNPVEGNTSNNRTEAPPAIEDVSRDSDVASNLYELRNSGESVEEPAKVKRAPKPTHISVPDVGIDAEIHQVGYTVLEVDGQRVREWDVASYAAGHHKTSARPGEGGNIVVTGHNDWEGEVFRNLEYVQHGQEVLITTEQGEHRYVIQEIHMRREVGVSLEERLETGRFMASMPEERLTLITCWPYGINDHRVIVVAVPVE